MLPDKSIAMDEEIPQEIEQDDAQTEVVEEVFEPQVQEDTTDWKAEALKYKAILDRKEKKQEEIKVTPQVPEDRLERIELMVKGYSESEIDFIVSNGGKRALDNEFVKAAIDAKRKEAEAAKKSLDATPSGSNSPVYRKHSEQDLRNMSVEDLEKILPKA